MWSPPKRAPMLELAAFFYAAEKIAGIVITLLVFGFFIFLYLTSHAKD